MQAIKYGITLDLKKPGTQTVINVKKNDTLTREICVSLVSNGKAYEIEDDVYAIIKMLKPDNSHIYNECTIEDNTISTILTTQSLSTNGCVKCEIVLYTAGDSLPIISDDDDVTISGTKVLTTPKFEIIVENELNSDGAVESTNEYGALISALSSAQTNQIQSITVSDAGYLTITYNGGQTFSYYVKGPQGIKGDAGNDGQDGEDGNPGVWIGDTEPTDENYKVWIKPNDVNNKLFPELVNKTATDTTVSIKPNKFYIFPTMTALSITLDLPDDLTVANEYHFAFQSGNTATTLSITNSNTNEGVAGIPENIEPNTRYEISIMNGFVVAHKWGV